MNDSTQVLILYVVVVPLAAIAGSFALRWAIKRFPSQTRRDLEDLQRRLGTIEEILRHKAQKEDEDGPER